MSEQYELAWAAGFFDGEGHIGLVKTGQNRHIHIQICQTIDGPLERFQAILGLGKIYGPYIPKKMAGKRKPYKQLHIDTFEHVQYTICRLWPWLSKPKRNQAKRVLEEFRQYLNRPKTKRGPKPQPAKIPSCHPERVYKAKGMCDRCYRKDLKIRRQNVN